MNYIKKFQLIRSDLFLVAIILGIGLFVGAFILYFGGTDAGLYLGLIIVAGAVFLIALFRPDIGLIFALMIQHNPYFNYTYLTLQGFRGGSTRALMSTFPVILLLYGITLKIFLRGKVARFRTPLDLPVLLFLFLSIIGALYGFLKGNVPRAILYQLFPIMEFGVYFFITTTLINTKKQLHRLLLIIMIWMVMNMLWETILYVNTDLAYGFRARIRGIDVNRIPGFLTPILLSIFVATFFYLKSSKLKMALMGAIVVSFIHLALTFWRSLYVGSFVSLVFIFWMLKGIRIKVKYLAATAVIGVIALSFGNILTKNFHPFRGRSLSSLFIDRLASTVMPEDVQHVSIGTRRAHIPILLREIEVSPLLGKGLGGEVRISSQETAFLSDMSNYYLIIAIAMGLPGLLSFFWVVLVLFREGLRGFKALAPGLYKGLTLGILASFVAMGVVLAFFPSIVHFPVFAYLGTEAALLFIIYRLYRVTELNQK